MRTPDIHDPATYWEAYYLDGEGRTSAKGGYVCYATTDASNAAHSNHGSGRTERKALLEACYWGNQPYRVVPLSKAPKWAQA